MDRLLSSRAQAGGPDRRLAGALEDAGIVDGGRVAPAQKIGADADGD